MSLFFHPYVKLKMWRIDNEYLQNTIWKGGSFGGLFGGKSLGIYRKSLDTYLYNFLGSTQFLMSSFFVNFFIFFLSYNLKNFKFNFFLLRLNFAENVKIKIFRENLNFFILKCGKQFLNREINGWKELQLWSVNP